MTDRSSDKKRDSSQPDVMTIEQLCSYLQLSRSTLYKLAQEGKLPGQKVGKHWRFHKQTVDEWLRGHEEGKR